MNKNITLIKHVEVLKFRALKDVTIPLAEKVTVICGKNGTAKSTILGLLAQIFNFERDHKNNIDLSYAPLHSTAYKSKFSDHFRLSEKYDLAGEIEATFKIHDGYFNKEIEPNLKFYKLADRRLPRPIVRNNITTETNDNDSRNVTHPVIYLGLKRLLPIADRNKYVIKDLEFLNQNQNEFIRVNNQLLCKLASKQTFTSTTGNIDSTVVHSDFYDHEAVSVGEDNSGQIIQAIFSFKKLKEEYSDYHGGLLLIDEADAGLFPGAQYQLKEILNKYAKDLNIQIVITTHSPILIEEYHQLSQKDPKGFKTIYLSNNTGKIEVHENFSWVDVFADISVKMKPMTNQFNLPVTNVYFEDDEARAFFNALVIKRIPRKPLKIMTSISMGCENYLELMRQKVPEFYKHSLLILDGDVPNAKIKSYKNVVKLPGELPPDQLLFDFLYNLPETDVYWTNSQGFTKYVFMSMSTVSKIVQNLDLPLEFESGKTLSFYISQHSYDEQSDNKIRQLFKNFFKSEEIQGLITKSDLNPYRYLVKCNSELSKEFELNLVESTKLILKKNKGVPSHLVDSWYESL